MNVYVVWSEYNHGYDLEGGGSVQGVYASKVAAEAAADAERAANRAMGCKPFGNEEDGDSDDDWGVDVHVEEHRLIDDGDEADACPVCGKASRYCDGDHQSPEKE